MIDTMRDYATNKFDKMYPEFIEYYMPTVQLIAGNEYYPELFKCIEPELKDLPDKDLVEALMSQIKSHDIIANLGSDESFTQIKNAIFQRMVVTANDLIKKSF